MAGEYIDFAELPPAKGKIKPIPIPDGNIILVQACDLLQQRKLIPDLGTWVQCFAVYASVICTKAPERTSDLLGYMSHIARACQKYKWPSWIIYDLNFRQEAAERGTTEWSQLDPSLYAQCFTGQAKSEESWCKTCHSVDHSSEWCPLSPPPNKRPKPAPPEAPEQVYSPPYDPKQACKKFNRYNGDCHHGSNCRYVHCCSNCRGPHPVNRCPYPRRDPQPGPSLKRPPTQQGPRVYPGRRQ